MYDLLEDEMITVLTKTGVEKVHLPRLMTLLCDKNVSNYTNLQAHQWDPWHVFLVQIAASIQARHPKGNMPKDQECWKEELLNLSNGNPEAWHLVVEDVTKPAFLQHPFESHQACLKTFSASSFENPLEGNVKARTPDDLDLLITSKNHDVKMSRMQPDDPEAWLYALLTSQTMSGFLGNGNYGVIRMNTGSGSRAIVSWTQSLDIGDRFCHDVTILGNMRQNVISTYRYASQGIVLTWLTPWNTKCHNHMLNALEPWFVEACRPTRLFRTQTNSIVALGATSTKRQIGPKAIENGDVGDPWIPINTTDKKKGRSALTVSSKGFSPKTLVNLMFEKGYELTELQKPKTRKNDETCWFVASALVGGMGKTDGFHRIEIPVPPKIASLFGNTSETELLGSLAQELLSDTEAVEQALKMALIVLLENGKPKSDNGTESKSVKEWLPKLIKPYHKQWNPLYFDTLWRIEKETKDKIRTDWQHTLVNLGEKTLKNAEEQAPLSINRLWKTRTTSERVWTNQLQKKKLPRPKHKKQHPEEDNEKQPINTCE